MSHKLPDDAFGLYVALGAGRSYQAVADHYKVARRTVIRAASRDNWVARLEDVERRAREGVDAKLAGDLEAVSLRHRKLLIAIASRAARAIQEYPLTSGMDGIRAAALVIKLERLLASDAPQQQVVDVEAIIKREQETWLVSGGTASDDWDDDEEEDEEADDEADDAVITPAQEGGERGAAGSSDAESA